jgi:hypothetical protein
MLPVKLPLPRNVSQERKLPGVILGSVNPGDDRAPKRAKGFVTGRWRSDDVTIHGGSLGSFASVSTCGRTEAPTQDRGRVLDSVSRWEMGSASRVLCFLIGTEPRMRLSGIHASPPAGRDSPT